MVVFFFFLFAASNILLGIAAAMVAYHIKRFRMKKDHHRGMMALFVAGFAALAYIEFLLLSATDWLTVGEIASRRFLSL